MPAATIRPAIAADVPLVLQLIRELAAYEKLGHEVTATERDLRESLFSSPPSAEVVIAETDGGVAGYALFFHNYSTFLAQRGVFLEDLFVNSSARGRGVGRALLARLAQIAVERDCGRLEWFVLDWNDLAISFYRSLGAAPMDDWTMFRLTGPALETLAKNSP